MYFRLVIKFSENFFFATLTIDLDFFNNFLHLSDLACLSYIVILPVALTDDGLDPCVHQRRIIQRYLDCLLWSNGIQHGENCSGEEVKLGIDI